MTDQIMAETIDFVQQRESTAVKQALQAVEALRDSVRLKKELCIPLLADTTEAILDLESQIHSLRLESLRAPHPDQPMLPCMEDLVPKVNPAAAS